jgi:cell division protein FtsQ
MTPGAATQAGRLRSLPRVPRVGDAARALLASKRFRRRLLLASAALLLVAAVYQFWLRDSSLAAVERVTITGLSTSDAERVRIALTSASRDMTTLHVDHEALERAVAGFPVVRELEVTTDFPHGLRIHVVEHVPAAIAVGDGGRVPVAGDGTILSGIPVEGRLPTVEVDGPLGVEQLRDATALASAAIAGTAPTALRGRIEEVAVDGELGQVAQLREGPELIFGNASRVEAKWAAAARVLADLEASGAAYVDVRIPGRPAVGGLPAETIVPVAPAGATPTVPPATEAGAATATDPAATGTVPPATGTVPPADGTVPPTDATVPPAEASPPGTTQTGTAQEPGTQAPAPAVESGAGGGAAAP